MSINRFVSIVSLTKCIISEYWPNIGRQNTLLAYLVTVRLGFPVAMLFPTLLPTSHPSENRAAQDWAIGRKILDRAEKSVT